MVGEQHSPVQMGIRVVRVEPDRFAVVGQRLVKVLFVLVGDAAVVVEDCKIVARELPAIDQPRAGSDDGGGLGRARAVLLVALRHRADNADA